MSKLQPVATPQQVIEFLDKLLEAYSTRIISKNEAVNRLFETILVKQNHITQDMLVKIEAMSIEKYDAATIEAFKSFLTPKLTGRYETVSSTSEENS